MSDDIVADLRWRAAALVDSATAKLIRRAADEIKRYQDADIMRGRAWEIARKLDEANDSVPTFMLPGYGYGIARDLTATATDDGITIEMQCGATILAVHLSPDEWDDFRAEGDDARDAFEAGALEDPDHDHDLER